MDISRLTTEQLRIMALAMVQKVMSEHAENERRIHLLEEALMLACQQRFTDISATSPAIAGILWAAYRRSAWRCIQSDDHAGHSEYCGFSDLAFRWLWAVLRNIPGSRATARIPVPRQGWALTKKAGFIIRWLQEQIASCP